MVSEITICRWTWAKGISLMFISIKRTLISIYCSFLYLCVYAVSRSRIVNAFVACSRVWLKSNFIALTRCLRRHDRSVIVKFSFCSWRVHIETFFLSSSFFCCVVNYFNKPFQFDKVSLLHFKGKQVLSRFSRSWKVVVVYCCVYCVLTEWLYL